MPQSSDRPTIAELATVTTWLSGYQLLADPLLNKGTAFTETERDAFDLSGLLPPNIGVLDEQLSIPDLVSRKREALHRKPYVPTSVDPGVEIALRGLT